jgi:uncharacterized protein (DUF1330 family)
MEKVRGFMKVENKLDPDGAQIAAFGEKGPEGPIYMVNMLKFKDKAEYEDGRETDLTGLEAYALYGQSVQLLLEKRGGGSVFAGAVTHLTIGAVEELWDMVAIATYPSRQAMLDMVMSPEYQEINVHRTAGLAGQLNIETIVAPDFGNTS